MDNTHIPGFREVPKTGVIYVMSEAGKLGFSYDHPQWANLGQGSPETGPLADAPARIDSVEIPPTGHRYAPVEGDIDLRRQVAELYNELFRKDRSSKYTFENVSISGGGRSALTRVAAALGNINMGHFLPDYTAYEELLSIFRAFTPIPLLLDLETAYQMSSEELRKHIMGLGLSAVLASNPCNPTGQLIAGSRLQQWVKLARETHCTFILDEFYSHFIYRRIAEQAPQLVSAAEYLDDVNRDPVIIVDGLTKNWRYPGWRISWTLAPKQVIERIASAGSFLDGGANNPFQRAAIPLLEPKLVIRESLAIQQHFSKKRRYMLERLEKLGISIEAEPDGAFYFWANLSSLPAPLNNGMAFFREGLKEKVITVPGVFFDVNPDHRRHLRRYEQYCRISFGPEMEKLELGLDAIERVIRRSPSAVLPD